MAVTEGQRHDLHTYFQETMGRDRADVMMDLLPPVGWGDVATKQDLDHAVVLLKKDVGALEKELGASVVRLEKDLGALEHKLTAELTIMGKGLKADIVDRMNIQLLGYFGLNVGLYGVTVGVLTLLR